MLDSLQSYHDEIRAVEDQWYGTDGPQRQGIGSSRWDYESEKLLEIQRRHGIHPDDAGVYSIASYLEEEKLISTDWNRLCEEKKWIATQTGTPEFQEFWKAHVRFSARLDDCRARHFPGWNGDRIDNRRKLWASIVFAQIPASHCLAASLSLERPIPEPDRDTVYNVYSLMHRLQIPWAPNPKYQEFTPREAIDELTRIANRLKAEDAALEKAQGERTGPKLVRDRLMSAIDTLLAFARDHAGRPLDKETEAQLKSLDAKVCALCHDAGISLDAIPLPKSTDLNAYGATRLPYRVTRLTSLTGPKQEEGPFRMTLCPTRAWEQAMRGIRAIAEERHRKSELAAAFEAVKSYTAETLWRELGREPALRKFIEAYAQRIVALGQQLVDKKDLLKRSLDEISDDGDEGKAVALTILQAGAKGDTERVVNLLFELERLGANDPRRSGAIDWLRGGLEREIMGYKVVEAPRTVPSYQCPGCSAQLSEHLRQVKSVRCPQCDSHEYHSGILRMPVSSQDGSSSVAVVPMGAWWEPVEPEGDHSSEAALKAVHSADFTMVDWFGTEYQFALGVQSSAVRALWEEWEKTGLGLHQETIREAIDAERDSFRMDTAFRNHDAFGTMIQRCGDGRYKLARPDTQLGSATPKTKRNTKRAPKSRRRRA